MKRKLIFVLAMLVVFVSTSALWAQQTPSVETIPFESLAAGMKLSPDDHMLAVYNNAVIYNLEDLETPPELSQIRLFDVQTGETIGSLKGHTDWVTDLDFSSDGSTLVSFHRNGDLLLWDVASQSLIKTIVTYTLGGGWVRFMNDDRTVVMRLGEYVFGMLDTETGAITRLFGRRITTFNQYSEVYTRFPERADLSFITVTVSPDGESFAAATGNDEVVLGDLASGEQWTLREKSEEMARYAIRSLVFSSDGSTLTYFDRDDAQIHVWDVEAGSEIAVYDFGASAFTVAPDDTTIAWADRETQTVYLADTAGSAEPVELVALPESLEVAPVITSLAFNLDGTQLIVGGLFAEDEQNAIYVIDLSE